jgi:hypothetical protein
MSTHVDDFYVVSSKQSLLDTLHQELNSKYGEVSVKSGDMLAYLGVQISKIDKSGRIKITQPGYVKSLEELLKLNDDGTVDANHKDYLDKRVYNTPMSTVDQHASNSQDPIDSITYLRIVGGINYLAQFTRPDLLYPLSRAAQHCANPTKHDMRLVKRILKYIRCTHDYGVVFQPGKIELVCYVDSSHNYYPDGHGHYGYTFSLGEGDGVFHAVSKKMKLITLSSTESEYVAICEACREAVFMRGVLEDLGFKQRKPTKIWEDNQSTIKMVGGSAQHQASKHINPKFHYSRERATKGDVKVDWKPTEDMIADVLTKPLGKEAHQELTKRMLNLS